MAVFPGALLRVFLSFPCHAAVRKIWLSMMSGWVCVVVYFVKCCAGVRSIHIRRVCTTSISLNLYKTRY